MKSVLMRFEGPLQAWSTQSRFKIRDTEREPSKSGVFGLVGAALGMERSDAEMLAELRTLTMAVRVDRSGTLLRDYHTAGAGTFRGKPLRVYGGGKGKPAVTERYYLQDARFFVALAGADELIGRISSALRNPTWPLFLGRKSCVPSSRIFVETREGDSIEAVRQAPADERSEFPWRLVCESDAAHGQPRNDVPLSFEPGNIRYGTRFVISKEEGANV